MPDAHASTVSAAFALLGPVWRRLVGVAALALVPALTATAVVDVLSAAPPDAIVNGVLTSARSGTWTSALISVSVGGRHIHVVVPVLVGLGMFLSIAVGLRIVGGDGSRAAWRWVWRRSSSLLALAVVLAITAMTALFALAFVAAQSGDLAPVVLIGGGLVCWCTWVRMLLALPLLASDDTYPTPTRGVADALQRGWVASRGKTIHVGTALLATGVVAPGMVGYLLSMAPRIAAQLHSSPTVDAIWVAAVAGVTDIALFATVALHAALLSATLPILNDEPEPLVRKEDETVRPQRPRRHRRILALGALIVAAAVPATASAAVLVANPRGLPVATVSGVDIAVRGTPLAFTALADGTTAMVDTTQVVLCRDAHCNRAQTVGMPCDGGEQPAETSPDVYSCSSVGPYVAADVTPDGTLLALVRGQHMDGVQLIRCSVLRPTPQFGACGWTGATALRDDSLITAGPMAVAASPSGGFVAAALGSGTDDAHGVVLLFSCDRLDCPQLTVSLIASIPMHDRNGALRVAADRTGVTLGYLDRQTATLWLGHCAGSCASGLTLAQAGSWPDQPQFAMADLQVVATSRGPRALVTAPIAAPGSGAVWTASVSCTDPACAEAHGLSCECWGPTRLAADGIGQTYEIATGTDQGTPWIANATNRPRNTLVGKGTVVAATFGADDRLRLLLTAPAGTSLVTCAERDCQPPCPPDWCVWL